jgi:hypothetical protein
MRLSVIDASPIAGGPVTRALEVAAAQFERAGGQVSRVRLYDLFTASCSTCTSCVPNGRCARRVASHAVALENIGGADVLVVGTAGHLHARDPRCDALLRRLVGAFAAVETRRGLERHNSRAGARKCAGLVTSAPPLLGLPARMGMLPAGLGSVRRVLDRAGVEVVGSATVATRWSRPADWDVTRERAGRLGRLLSAAAAAPPVQEVPEPLPLPARVPHLPAMRTA